MKKRRTLPTNEFTPPHSKQSPAPLGRFIGPSFLVGGPSTFWVRLDLRGLWTLETKKLFISIAAQHRTDTIGQSLHHKTTKASLKR